MNEQDRNTLERAIEVTVVAHAGQTDKNDEPYILHPRVMHAVTERPCARRAQERAHTVDNRLSDRQFLATHNGVMDGRTPSSTLGKGAKASESSASKRSTT